MVSVLTSPNLENPRASARLLYACTQSLGKRGSNAVLEVLGGLETVETERKYPREYLRFGNGHWRAYYHCHDMPGRLPEEHGHFHIFTRISGTGSQSSDWIHVVALAMDAMGQPLAWFTVNRWVAGGVWLPGAAVADSLERLPDPLHLSLVERWLAAMLGTWRPVLAELVQRRDTTLEEVARQRGTCNGAREELEALLDDRSLYALSASSIDLAGQLAIALGPGHAEGYT